MHTYCDAVKEKLESYKHLGIQLLEDGTKLIAKAPHVAPQAWLHKIFSPLKANEILYLEGELNAEIPDTYKHFLLNCSNGLKIFSDAFSLNGLRKIQGRTVESTYQPYSIITRNRNERLKDADPDMFFIGSYSLDGSLFYIQKERVYRCTRTTVVPLNEWESFSEMLLSEVNRIALLYDKEGKQIIEDGKRTHSSD